MDSFLLRDLLLLKKEKKIYSFSLILISLLPLILLLSSSLANISVVILCLFFVFLTIQEKSLFFFKDPFFIFLLIFFFYILVNLFFSTDFEVSLSRSIGFIRFVLFPFAIAFFLKKNDFKYIKLILQSWTVIFLLISVDLTFEIVFGHNMLGMSNNFPGRLSGILGDELKIGHYYYGFCFISLSLIILTFKKNSLSIIGMLTFITISLMIGERANFIKLFLGTILFIFFWYNLKLKFKILLLLTIVITSLSLINLNKDLNSRFKGQFITYLTNNGLTGYYYNSQYGAHYGAAIKIFKNYPIMGTGLRTFYNECNKDIYSDEKFLSNDSKCTTHPHQLHLEILSQLGIIGYLIFLTFISYFLIRGFFNYQKYKNLLHLSALIFIFTTIFLPLPSGSFFTTYGAIIFWTNVGLVLAFEKKKISFI